MIEDIKKRALHRTKILQGQLRGVEKMIENEDYCVDIITQSLAIQSSLRSLNKLLVETFPHIFNVEFTAKMEGDLDRIEAGEDNWVETVRQFYGSWKDTLKDANDRRKAIKRGRTVALA